MNPNGGRLPVGGANAPPKLLTVRADALQMADGTPLKNIEKYRSQDVLCGRGGGTNHHVGNAHWRKLVNNNKRLYLSLPKKQKALVAKSIVHAVRAQNPPGRFLAKDPTNSLWCDIGDQKATEKTSQALREGAPDIRTEMAKEGQMEKGNVIVGGGNIMLQNGLIGLDQNKSGAGKKDNVPYAQAGMPPTNIIPSSQKGFPMPDGQGEDASMMMAFQQYLGGKNQNPSIATQSALPTLPTSTSPTKLSISQAPSLQQHQQPQLLGALASRQLLNSDLARETYQQTFMSRKMSGGARSVLDNPLMQTNPQCLNFGNRTMVSYDEFTQSVANRSRDGLQMTNQAASAMRQQPSQIVSSIYNDGLWSVPTGIPLESQRMTDLLRSSSLSSAASLGRTSYLGNNKLTNNMLGNAASSNEATSIGKGSNFISQVGPNTTTLAKLLEQRKSLLTNQLKGGAMASLGLLSNPVLLRESSVGGQFPHLTPPSDSGQFVGNNGTGLTSLHPSVSAVIAQMKLQELMKKNREEASQLNNVVTQRLGHFSNMTTQPLGSPRDDAGTSIPTTSAPKRGVSATLDDLCRAAGLDDHQPSKPPSSLAEDLYKKDEEEDQVLDFCNRVKTKKKPKTPMPKLGVNDSSLVDDDSEEDVIKYLTTKRRRTDFNVSAKEDSKRSKLITKGEEDSELDRFVTQKGLRDDLLSRGLSLNRNFSQKIRSLPLSETLLDRGHSLAMSEISLDRGQSLNEIGLMGDNDGQFDDASEEDEVPTFASKTAKVTRAGTLGTINTFPLDM